MARILIVDDEPLVLKSHQRMLAGAGYECVLARNADDALKELDRQPIDLLLSDIKMPGKSGLDLVRRLSSEHPDLAIVMVTGVNNSQIADLLLKRGVFGYLVKPVEKDNLLITVSNALKRREADIESRKCQGDLIQKVEEQRLELNRTTSKLMDLENRLINTYTDTVFALTRIIELRTRETSAHNQRIGHYCEVLAKHLAMDSNRCMQIRMASSLHDIGKIGIPDHILFKSEKLTEEETILLNTHTTIGYQLLSASKAEVLILAATIARSHHEQFDGKGYPLRLQGDKIPLEGRIVAVADGFDTLVSNNQHAASLSPNRVAEVMKAARGSLYDPTLLDLFLDILPKIWAIRQRFSDPSFS